MSRLAALKSASTLSDLADLLGFKPPALAYLLYKISPTSKYTAFTIPKSSGGIRTIQAPIPQLKLLQRNVATLLDDCWAEKCAEEHLADSLAHGFKRSRSIFSNGRKHRNRNFVFNVDLLDFFPSINFGRVRGYLIRDRSFSLQPRIATLIAQIACHDNALPQGSPCSPVISNLIGHMLDVQLVAMAAKHGCTYSRYADDLTFSTNEPAFPKSIATPAPTTPHVYSPGSSLIHIVARNGFALNPAKTRMQYHDSRQLVTGLIVNRKVNVPREFRHRTRAMVHNLLRSGTFNVKKATGAASAGSVAQLHGLLTFIDSIDLRNRFISFSNSDKRNSLGKPAVELTIRDFGAKSSKDIGPLTPAERLFQRFLIYKDFYAAPKPTVVCEGGTDNVYLLHAIHQLDKLFPQLIAPPGTPQRLRVRLFKYVGTRVGRLLGLGDGGGTVLKTLVDSYLREAPRFLAKPSANPFIVLVDNDTGSKALQGVLKKHGLSFPPAGGFVHLMGNLYIVRTPPLPGKPETDIEDFFDAKTKGHIVDGKTFHPSKGHDPSKHYGKVVFAHKVVRANAASIDFSGFTPILQTVVDILNHKPAVTAKPTPPSSP